MMRTAEKAGATKIGARAYVPRTRLEREALAQLAYHRGRANGVVVARFGSYGPGEGAWYQARFEVEGQMVYGHAWWENHDQLPVLRVKVHLGGWGRQVVEDDVDAIVATTQARVRAWHLAEIGADRSANSPA
jgi:hypothetical protein